MTASKVAVARLQQRLATIWGVTFVLGFGVMLALNSRFGSATAEGWGWFSQAVLPIAGVVVSGLVQAQQSADTRRVTPFFARFTCAGLSFYGLAVLLTPFIAPADEPLMKWLQTSATWLGLLQGLLAGLIAFAFNKQE